jgi:hypothetical protein
MDVEVTVGRERQHSAPWFVRLAEIAGLIAVIWGLAASQWWLSLCGLAMILASYALYRGHHRAHQRGNGDSDSGQGTVYMNECGDGDGGSGGGE